ncbi:Calpain-A [Clonorchis sinensis]|uniref:Calpain-A n=1 Tax=Clonorchis sinensis TaxID=79923 RepID=A0A3R7JU74_CLOSI|nr:Calpain-A [Clonorchis sinensis]
MNDFLSGTKLSFKSNLNSVTLTTGDSRHYRSGMIFKFPRFEDPRIALRKAKDNKVVLPFDAGETAKKPVPVTRGGALASTTQSYDELKVQLLQQGRLFEDPEFPPVDSSLYYSQPPPRPVQWLRPHEICQNPEFITGGASRFDVRQGQLGDCWLLAAIACLSMHKELFEQVVPADQTFGSGYCGLFRFHFWRFGEWKEVVVDDRLPTYGKSLIYIHSTEKNEFWSALMEKAYAKLCGSYEALKGGTTSEALEDFTGGIAEMFELRSKCPPDLFKIMLKSQERCSLMACSIQADPNRYEARLANGLIMGHAYSVTSVKMIDTSTAHQVALVRVRNPWGDEAEWKGAWSDKSPEWNQIPAETRQLVGLTFEDDGEFWMSYKDFISNFEKLEICHLGPQSLGGAGELPGRKWEMCIEHGNWIPRVSAGGCRNFLESEYSTGETAQHFGCAGP